MSFSYEEEDIGRFSNLHKPTCNRSNGLMTDELKEGK